MEKVVYPSRSPERVVLDKYRKRILIKDGKARGKKPPNYS